ncbi:2-amino-4-hydroxy-6-hydroxymethyldihydropteridine diphosphokinase [Radicibacter daui]|uniref:2-amino-4-hydroxy-6- hydroxymethyldihydropteridine diphosphokinase n=1 Tax=Radicibacter daui TaxID=3064829 RepID=UPI004046A657
MILVAIGSNLFNPPYRSPLEVCKAAIKRMPHYGIRPVRLSAWYRTAPVPVSDQPWYTNAVVAVETKLPALETLWKLHDIESEFGRVRQHRFEARILDLDLIDYNGQVVEGQGMTFQLPHPRTTERSFVLLPLRDVCPDWRHPVTDRTIDDLIADLPKDQTAEPIA